MRLKAGFQQYFETELKVLLQPLEDYRIGRIRKFKKIQYLVIFLSPFFLVSLILGKPLYCAIGLLTIIFFEAFAFEHLGKTNRALKLKYKTRILPILIGFVNTEFKYIPNQRISKSVFDKSFLFPHEVSKVDGEYFMSFKIGDVEIMFCESQVYSYGPTSVMFEGIFISATFNKYFSSKTFIFPEKTTSFFRKLRFKVLGSSFNVKLEDPEFEREFIVLSDDQVESRYILTTSFMQRILDYKKKLKVEIAFSFIGNRLYCTIPSSKNLFEPALFESFMDINFLMQSYEPIMLYAGLVDDLNLNLRIWSKQ